MGKLFKNLHRPRTTHQDVTDNLIITSNSWFGRNDLHIDPTRKTSRNIKRARRQSDSIKKYKPYKEIIPYGS
ncbi:hypothetical protein F5ESL0230_04800 [Lactobacillus sp. ESL0230]|nr:hypothetical protein F5ESL0230_04800 [Lactobacillus sp. ESL0230]